MSYLSKLQFKTVTRIVQRDPVQERRTKFIGAAEEQRLVVAAVSDGDTYTKRLKNKGGDGSKRERIVRPWFFRKDAGWYLQPRYGARIILIDGISNAIYATTLDEVDAALMALVDAAKSGELDPVLELAGRRGNQCSV